MIIVLLTHLHYAAHPSGHISFQQTLYFLHNEPPQRTSRSSILLQTRNNHGYINTPTQHRRHKIMKYKRKEPYEAVGPAPDINVEAGAGKKVSSSVVLMLPNAVACQWSWYSGWTYAKWTSEGEGLPPLLPCESLVEKS